MDAGGESLMKLSFLLASSLVWLGLSCTSKAELITVRFAGTVNGVFVQNRPQLQGYDFPDVGDPFTGFYKFDSTAQDTASSPQQGSFKTLMPNNTLSVSVGDFHFKGMSTVIVAFQNAYALGDHISSIELVSNASLSQLLDIKNFSLSITRQNLHNDPNILPFPPHTLDGSLGSLSISMKPSFDLSPAQWVSISSSLDYLAIVPEPATLMSVMTFLISLLAVRGSRISCFDWSANED
jgi:hypothetical protein